MNNERVFVEIFLHPQGCHGYLVIDQASNRALVIDPHLDLVQTIVEDIKNRGCKLDFIIETHTHADHPSGAALLKSEIGGKRVAHQNAEHEGLDILVTDGELMDFGTNPAKIIHAPGHTPDSIVIVIDDLLFTGDSLLIDSIARTDFIGGDAGQLYDTIQRLLKEFSPERIICPAHDYNGRESTTLGDQQRTNPWLKIKDRDTFIEKLTANPPPKPLNMDQILEYNRNGVDFPKNITAAKVNELVKSGGASSIIDVRTDMEYDSQHIENSVHIPLSELNKNLDRVRRTPAPRLILCRSGARASKAQAILQKANVLATSVITGGIIAYMDAGGEVIKGRKIISLERQVRIAAGSLVLIGVLLSIFVHPGCIGLSAFVGCGLVFAGITDTCGMGIMLSKMPWNKRDNTPESTCSTSDCSAAAPPSCAASAPETSKDS